MTSDTSPRPVSPLRARMIEDMTVRGFKADTRRDYVRHGIRARRGNALAARPAKGATDCLGKRTSNNLARDRFGGCSRGADRDQFRLRVV